MKLSRLVLNPLHREVASLVGDAHRLHAFVLRAFGPADSATPRASLGVLHRLELDPSSGALALIVQSERDPDWTFLDPKGLVRLETGANPGVWEIDESAWRGGAVLRFRLRANATRKIDTKTGPDGVRRHGRRVPVRGDDGRIGWLETRAERAGFALHRDTEGRPDMVVVEEDDVHGTRGGRRLTFASTRYEGRLVVRDADLFRRAVAAGVGPARAYGFGLLSVRVP